MKNSKHDRKLREWLSKTKILYPVTLPNARRRKKLDAAVKTVVAALKV